MADYRDYGYISSPVFDQEVDTIRYGQVYQATHDGEGIRLPLMKRSFISFMYGGKHIEDFNLLATISNNRLDRSLYTPFKDNVTSYDNLDGRKYWGTHYQTTRMEFTLSTDGIDQRMLDNFKYWFQAGVTRELILAEHPNRAILARVAEAPRMQLLPFEDTVQFKPGSGKIYTTKTTLYKGDITLVLESDSPHWYALQNLLGHKVEDYYLDEWKYPDDPDEPQYYINIFTSQDALKILYEDGIPLGSAIEDNMLLGNGAYAIMDTRVEGQIWSPESTYDEITWTDGVPSGQGARIAGTLTEQEISDYQSQQHQTIPALPGGPYKGVIQGAIIDASGNGVDAFTANTDVYFFYSGTAPAYTTLSFTMKPQFNSAGIIINPANEYALDKKMNYSTITVESRTKQELRLTTPNLYTSYNMAIKIIKDYQNDAGKTWEDLFRQLREEVRHLALRAWISAVLTYGKTKYKWEKPSNMDVYLMIQLIQYFFMQSANTNDTFPATFTFNSETGEATAEFQYRTLDKFSMPSDDSEWEIYGVENSTIVKEDVGDMLRSNYIIIRERNYPSTVSGKIKAWSGTNEDTKAQSHRIYHNIPATLNNLQIIYKNMYL